MDYDVEEEITKSKKRMKQPAMVQKNYNSPKRKARPKEKNFRPKGTPLFGRINKINS